MKSFATKWIFMLLMYFVEVMSSRNILEFGLEDLRDLQVSGDEWDIHDKQAEFTALYFDKAGSRNLHPKFLKEYQKAASALNEFNVQLAKLNCKKLKEDLKYCHKDYQSIHVYRRGRLHSEILLDTVFNEDSIVANLLQAALTDDVRYISDKQDLDDLLESMKDFQNVVFGYVKGMGLKEHRYILENAHIYSLSFTFALTTNEELANNLGLKPGDDASLWIFLCKPPFPKENITLCQKEQYKWKIKKLYIARYLQYQHLPKVDILHDDGISAYSDASLTLGKLYVFDDRVDQLAVQQLKEFGSDKQGALGIVVVDVAKHRKLVSSFGISENAELPMFALMLGGPKLNGEDLVEHIHAHTFEKAKEIISAWLENPEKEYHAAAKGSSLEVVSHTEYKEFVTKRTSKYLLAAFCAHDVPDCKVFGQNYRRLVRSLDFPIPKPVSIRVIYVELVGQDYGKHNLPDVRFHTSISVDNYMPLYGGSSYDGMLKFVRDQTKNHNVPRLPPSSSDRVPINQPVEEVTNEESGDPEAEPEEEDYPPEEIEDGEVADAIMRLRKKKPKVVNDVLALTDKTFNTTRNASLVLLVHFYLHWEPRCSAFHQPFADAAESLKTMNVKDVKLARVNCFDWTDVCQKENITHYPTIKMYRKGSQELLYKAPLDSKHVIKSALLLLAEAPTVLNSSGEAKMFAEGKLPKSAELVTDVAVLGMFYDNSYPGVDAFRAAAGILRTQFLLGYTTGEVAKREARKLSVSLPAVVLFKRNDVLRSQETFDGEMTAENVVQFVRLNSLPAFGELTPLNLPLYYAHRKPLVIVFNSKKVEDQYSPIISKIARQSSGANVFFCWIDLTSNEVNSAILKAYTDEVQVPTLVAVDHRKGAVYQYSGDTTQNSVEEWVENCVKGKAKKKSVLKEGTWRPLMDGYDFLKKIGDDEAQKKKDKEESDSERVDEQSQNDDLTTSEVKPRHDKIQWKNVNNKETKDGIQASNGFGEVSYDKNEKDEDEDLEKSEEFETEDNNGEQEHVAASRLRLPQHHGHHEDKHSGHDEL